MSEEKYYVTGPHHGKKVSSTTNSLVSSISLPKIEPEEGKLYFSYLSERQNSPFIGEESGGYLIDGATNKNKHNGLLMDVDIESLVLYIVSSDGKQKHSDLVDEHIGEKFPLVGIGNHDKYKYQTEIEGELVSLSAKNVVFGKNEWYKDIKFNHNDYLYKYFGIPIEIISTPYTYLGTVKYVKIRTIKQNYVFYVPHCLIEKDDSIMVIGLTNIQEKEIKDKNLAPSLNKHRDSEKSNINYVKGVFNEYFIVESKGQYSYVNMFIIDKEELNKVKEEFEGRYYYKNNLFLLKNKWRKSIINEKKKPNNRRRMNRRGTFREHQPNIENIMVNAND